MTQFHIVDNTMFEKLEEGYSHELWWMPYLLPVNLQLNRADYCHGRAEPESIFVSSNCKYRSLKLETTLRRKRL